MNSLNSKTEMIIEAASKKKYNENNADIAITSNKTNKRKYYHSNSDYKSKKLRNKPLKKNYQNCKMWY